MLTNLRSHSGLLASADRDALVTVYEESLRAVLIKTEAAFESAHNALESSDVIAVLEHQILFLKRLIAEARQTQN